MIEELFVVGVDVGLAGLIMIVGKVVVFFVVFLGEDEFVEVELSVLVLFGVVLVVELVGVGLV